MADPYAAREGIAVGEQPGDAEPARELVGRLGGFCALELGDLVKLGSDAPAGAGGAVRAGEAAAAGAAAVGEATADVSGQPAGDRFVAVVVRDEGPLPPIAAIDPAFAVVLLTRGADGAGPAAAGLAALEAAGLPVYALKQGLVAGPAGREGAYAVKAELIERLLAAALADEIEWETDPDFGYRVVAGVPGLEGADADALCPRLLYAAADRVYEHAEAVATLKAERRRRIEAVPGIDERILAATGWPATPTGTDWKD